MYKTTSKFIQRKANRLDSKKKRNVSKIAGNVLICSICGQPQLETNLKHCLKCSGEIAKQFGDISLGLTKFTVFKTFQQYLFFLIKTTNKPSKLNNLFLEIYPIELWEIKISQHVYPDNVKFVLSKLDSDLTAEKSITGREFFEGDLNSLATTKNICHEMFASICGMINKISRNKIKSHYLQFIS